MLNTKLVTLAVCLANLISRSAYTATFIRGDVDESGAVEIADSIRIFGHLFLGDPGTLSCDDAADSNDADGLDISDGIYLLLYLFAGGPPPPRPFPACGLDALRPDGLQCGSHEPCKPPSCFTSVNGKVDVGGFSLYAQSGGVRCPPTIVLDAGLSDTSVAWNPIFDTIVQHAICVRYDRAWLGNSDPGPESRTSEEIVTELHVLLANAGFEPPYILVGHSMGGYNIRVFASKYPDEVAGMVFVEPSIEDFWNRFIAELPVEFEQYLQWEGDAFSNASTGTSLELEAWKVQRVRAPGLIPSVPIAVLTGLRDISAGLGIFPPETGAALARLWDEAHESLAHSVTRGIHIHAEQSGHQVQWDEPKVVIDAILQILEAAQSVPTP